MKILDSFGRNRLITAETFPTILNDIAHTELVQKTPLSHQRHCSECVYVTLGKVRVNFALGHAHIHYGHAPLACLCEELPAPQL